MHFDHFDDDAHIWIYGFNRNMSVREKDEIEKALENFTTHWNSHGKPVNGGYLILHNRFAILAVSKEDFVSGCSVDSSVRVFKNIKEMTGLDGLDVNLVFYRKNQEIHSTNRIQFQLLIDQDEVGSETVVFDTSIQTVGDLRSGKFEQPLSHSWHATYFSLSA